MLKIERRIPGKIGKTEERFGFYHLTGDNLEEIEKEEEKIQKIMMEKGNPKKDDWKPFETK